MSIVYFLLFLASVGYLVWAFHAIANDERQNPPRTDKRCPASFCGELNVSYPFRLRGDRNCLQKPGFELTCTENATALMNLTRYTAGTPFHGSFLVKGINYSNQQIRIIDPRLANLSSFLSCPLPKYTLGRDDFDTDYYQNLISWVRCKANMSGDPRNYIPIPCFHASKNVTQKRSYVVLSFTLDEINGSCELIASTLANVDGSLRNLTFEGIRRYMGQGFAVGWYSLCKYCDGSSGPCPSLCDPITYAYENVKFTLVVVFIIFAFVVGGITGLFLVSQLIGSIGCGIHFVMCIRIQRHDSNKQQG